MISFSLSQDIALHVTDNDRNWVLSKIIFNGLFVLEYSIGESKKIEVEFRIVSKLAKDVCLVIIKSIDIEKTQNLRVKSNNFQAKQLQEKLEELGLTYTIRKRGKSSPRM